MIFSSIEPKGQSDIVITLLLSSSVNCHISMFFSEISGLIETQLFYGLTADKLDFIKHVNLGVLVHLDPSDPSNHLTHKKVEFQLAH
jgi:hypothetical protein